jgi:hypothetical protein
MKTIQSILQTTLLVASLSMASASLRGGAARTRQLLAKWQVTYDTSRACQPGKAGTVVATVKPAGRQAASRSAQPTVVLKVSGAGKTYSQTSRTQSNGRATVALSATDAFPPQGRRTNLACTLQVGTTVQKVACPVLPVCAPPPTPSPTSSPTPDCFDAAPPSASPTHIDELAPTSAPTPEDTGIQLYDVLMKSGPVPDTPSCLDAFLSVIVRDSGKPVPGRKVDLLVVANGSKSYEASATTNAKGGATLFVTLDPADRNANLWTSLAVENPRLPQSQQEVPTLNFGC